MNIKEFIKYYDNLNEKETEKLGEYGENYTWVEYYSGEHKIDFLKEFTKVFKGYPLGDIIVDEGIGFISNTESFYIGRDFLEFCLDKKLYKDKAYYFYYHNLDNNMGKDNISYEKSLLTYKK